MKRKCLAVGIILLFLGTNISPSVVSQFTQSNILLNSANMIIVDDEGDGDYGTIQEAISHAELGDAICVFSGNYYENITVDKALILEGISHEYGSGDDKGKPVIFYYSSIPVVEIRGEKCKITGFSIINNVTYENSTGILLNRASNSNISENNITDCFYGIDIDLKYTSKECSFFKNIISNCEFGIRTRYNNHVVSRNTIIQCFGGICLSQSRNCEVYNNILIGNKTTNNDYGILARDCVNISIYSNHIENFSIGLAIDEVNEGGIILSSILPLNDRDSGKTIGFGSTKIPKSQQISSRALKIHHNNFINNTNSAFIYIWRFSLFFLIFLSLNSIIHFKKTGIIVYPRPLVFQNHFYENYWDDKSTDKNVYEINGVIIPLGPLGLLYDLIVFDFNELYVINMVKFDWHPAQEPYDIPGMT